MRKIYEKRFQWKFFKTQIICNVKNSCINNSWLNIKSKYEELDQNFTQKLLQDPFSQENTSSFNIIVLGIRQKKDVSSWFRLWKRGTWWFHQTQVGLHLKDDVCVKKTIFIFPHRSRLCWYFRSSLFIARRERGNANENFQKFQQSELSGELFIFHFEAKHQAISMVSFISHKCALYHANWQVYLIIA